MQRFFDKLIGYVRSIEVAGVNVIDAEPNNFAQDGECTDEADDARKLLRNRADDGGAFGAGDERARDSDMTLEEIVQPRCGTC